MAQLAAKGSFRKNEKKNNPKSPDWIGSLTAQENIQAGEKVFLGIWQNVDDRGNKYASINATFPDTPQPSNGGANRGGYQQRQAPASNPPDDDFPDL
jgi:hypothetical protein